MEPRVYKVTRPLQQIFLLQRFFILKVKLSGKDALENLKEHIAQKKFSQFTFCAICGLELQTVAFTERMI